MQQSSRKETQPDTEQVYKLLYVDDETGYQHSFRAHMRLDDRFQVETASNGQEALETLEHFPAQIVLTDYAMPIMDGMELLEAIKEHYPETFVLMLTGVDSAANAVRAMKAGAYDYLLKPFDFDMVVRILEKIITHNKVLKDGTILTANTCEMDRFENIIGKDPKMYEIYERITQVARSNATVLINGESGTGKELIAEAIHARSLRNRSRFMQVNCAALTEELINSELFGHEKGSFTGAIAQKKGLFELADGGTLFLDEIGDIPLQTQVALLRVLELGTFQRVGGTETIHVDTRVICATNKDLIQAIKDRQFREDLYYRINVVSMRAPSLSERRSDIPLLANFFLQKFCIETGKKIRRIAPNAMQYLMEYNWPGNVRELTNAIEHAVIFCRKSEIQTNCLPNEICHAHQSKTFELNLSSPSLAEAESSLIRKVLMDCHWNLKQAADLLQIARGTLYSKMEKYQIIKPRE